MILVTGPTGFVGRRVVEALTSGGHPVRALVHTPSAVVRERGNLTFGRINYDGTRNLLEATASAGVRRIIFVSAIGAGPDPAVPYLHSRWMAEQEVERSPVSHTIVRFSVGFGEGDEFFNVLAAGVKLSPLVPVAGDGKSGFQPIAVEDVARCLVAAYEDEDTAGRTMEAGGPEHLTYNDMLDLIAETLGSRIVKVHVPVSLMRPAVAVMEALAPRPPVTRQQLKMLALDSATELDSVKKAFGFSPRPVSGNIGYVTRIGLRDAVKINLGFMPAGIRDH